MRWGAPVIEAYHRALAQRETSHAESASGLPAPASERLLPSAVEIVGVRLSGEDDVPRDAYRAGESLKATLTYRLGAPAAPRFGFEIVRADGLCVYGARMAEAEAETAEGGEMEITIDSLELVGASYFFNVVAYGREGQAGDRHTHRYPFRVFSDLDETGVVRLRHRWRVVEPAGR
jgi:hypothetical protein